MLTSSRLQAMLRCLAVALLIAPVAAQAADVAVVHTRRAHAATRVVAVSPYPMSWRSRKIRKADRCWRTCEAAAGHVFQACLRVNALTDCLPGNDAADRACQWQCRLYGGPLVDWAE